MTNGMTIRIPVKLQRGKWKAIWSKELTDALVGSDDVIGTEVMMHGRFRIEFDNDKLTAWMVLMTEDDPVCPKCGSDEIEFGTEDLERRVGICVACGEQFDRTWDPRVPEIGGYDPELDVDG